MFGQCALSHASVGLARTTLTEEQMHTQLYMAMMACRLGARKAGCEKVTPSAEATPAFLTTTHAPESVTTSYAKKKEAPVVDSSPEAEGTGRVLDVEYLSEEMGDILADDIVMAIESMDDRALDEGTNVDDILELLLATVRW